MMGRKIVGDAREEIGMVIMLALVVLAFFGVVVWRDSSRFVVVKYRMTSPKLLKRCRIVMLSDLHNKEYGTHNGRLVEAVHAQEPDLIIVAGDMVTSDGKRTQFKEPLELLRQLALRYPVYYGTGNHEYRIKPSRAVYAEKYKRYAEALRKYGGRLLENGRVYLPEYNMEICGLELGRAYYKRLRRRHMDGQCISRLLGKSRTDCLEALIGHNPDYFEQYAAWGAELVFAGHVHGGVVRVPALGGVISPAARLFPKYDGGSFEEYGSRMILGRGLGMHTIPVRAFNPGELVVVELEPGA